MLEYIRVNQRDYFTVILLEILFSHIFMSSVPSGKYNRYGRYRKMERIVRGFSNHRRIAILELLARRPELSVDEISEILSINYKTASEHIRRLAIAGLIMKRNQGASVRHKLTKIGGHILKFLRTLE